MTGWSEENFLERLSPQLRRKRGTGEDSCPDAETLCAVIAGEARGPERDTVIEHLSRCAACTDLPSRLLNFESGSPTEPEAVWNPTRNRLDHWLEGFLRSEAAHLRSPKRGKASGKVSGGESISNLFTPRKIIWALSAALVLVLMAIGVVLLEHKRERLPQVQVAVRPTVSPTPPEQSTEEPEIAPQEGGLPKVGENFPSRAESPNGPQAGEPRAPGAPALTPASANHNLPGRVTQAAVPSSPNPASRSVAPPTAPASSHPAASTPPGPTELATGSLPAPPSLPRNPAAAAIGHPPRLWLNPSVRILIVVSSISRKPDGSFQFHGILLLPVAQPEAVPLGRGAEVIGVGTRNQDQISVAITDLVVQEVHYTLKDGSGEMNAQTPGAGGGVHLDRSQVLEMWPMATAAYERAPDQTGQTEHQN